jgi:DAK2 domain fusion protein YloV
MAHAVAHGALMGARGNSGVILSQLWRGVARALDNQEVLDGPSLVQALIQGRDTAYKGVVRPVEGTILTVAKDIATAAEEALEITKDPFEILDYVIPVAKQSVQHTPELLPVLKEAGVVDAGGKGLFHILEGMVRFTNGQPLDVPQAYVQPIAAMNSAETRESIEPGQDFEWVIDFRPDQPLFLDRFYGDLKNMGTSIQVGEGDGFYRLHIHVPVEKFNEPIEYTRALGTVTKATLENLIAQMEELKQISGKQKLSLTPIEPGQIAVVAVSPGPGIAQIFASLKAAAIVEGGQTMNPSTQEIIRSFENIPTDHIIILPNNKNIILAAKAAAQLTVKSVAVVPSRSVPQGLSAILRYLPDGDFDRTVLDMTDSLQDAITGEITTATRSVEIDGVQVNEGQIIALLDGKLILATTSLREACLQLLAEAKADQREIITLFRGENLPKHEFNTIIDAIRDRYPAQSIEPQEGGQPHYQFIISIE